MIWLVVVLSATTGVEQRIAVVALDQRSVATVQALQRELSEAFLLVPVQEIAQALAVAPPRSAVRDRFLSQAKDAYYADKLHDSVAHLDTAVAQYQRTGTLSPEGWVELRLWRGAVYLALQDVAKARWEIQEALRTKPDLQIDLKVFRPSLATEVGRVRRTLGPAYPLPMGAIPPHAKFHLDGRVLTNPPKAFAGHYALRIEVPGYRPIPLSLLIPAQDDLGLPTLLDLPEELLRSLAQVHLAAGLPRSTAAEEFASALGLDAFLAVRHVTDQPNAIGLRRDNGVWRGRLFNGPDWRGKAMLWLGVPPDAPPILGAALGGTLKLSSTVGYRRRSLRSAGKKAFAPSMLGVGVSAQADIAYEWLWAQAGGSLITYALTRLEVANTVGAGPVRGGLSSLVSVKIGLHHRDGSRPLLEGQRLAIALSATAERFSAADLRPAGGMNLGVFPDQSRVAVGARVLIQQPITQVRLWNAPVISRVRLGIDPLSWWREKQARYTGRAPKAGIAGEWSIELASGGPWQWALRYHGAIRTVQFKGRGAAFVEPALTDALQREEHHSISLSLARSL